MIMADRINPDLPDRADRRQLVTVANGGMSIRAYLGLHALVLLPVTPLQDWSDRHSPPPSLQIFTHDIAVPMIASQIDPSGQPSVDPGVMHACVQ